MTPTDLPLLHDLLSAVALRLEEAAHDLRAAADLMGDGETARPILDPDRLVALLERSIDDLELTARTGNVLRSAGIRTVGDLTIHTRRAIHNLPHAGAPTMRELDEVLANLGLWFADSESD